MIRAVIFDVDGVLLDSFETNFLFFEELFRKTGFTPPTREEFKPMFHTTMWDIIKSVTNLDDDKKIEELWNFALTGELSTRNPKLSEGVAPVMQQLSKEFLLAVATSRVKIFEEPLADLKQYFKVAVGYEDTENHKPDPEPLLLATKRLGIRPEECVYIGDVENDVKAARAAGMKSIIYSQVPVAGADFITSRFEEMPNLIKKL